MNNDIYDVLASGHSEDCPHWVDNTKCSCGRYEYDMGYKTGYKRACEYIAQEIEALKMEDEFIYDVCIDIARGKNE